MSYSKGSPACSPPDCKSQNNHAMPTNPKKSRKADASHVGDAIQQLLNAYRLEGKFDETKLISSWSKIMGKPIASRTSRIFMKNDVLFVELTSAPLKHELNMSKQKITDLINQELGKPIVKEVIFM